MDVWSAIAFILGGALLGFFVDRFQRQRQEVLPKETPSPDARKAAAETLWQLYPSLPDEEPDTALFLLDESKRSYDQWSESTDRIEGKAARLLAFIAGGTGVLTLFSNADGRRHIVPGPFLYLAVGSAFLALLFCLYIVRPKLRNHPGVSDYVNPAVAISPKSRFHIALSLAEDYNVRILEIARLRRFDPVAWAAAQASVALAVFAILVHFLLYLGVPSSPTVLSCRGQSGTMRGGLALKISCEEALRAR